MQTLTRVEKTHILLPLQLFVHEEKKILADNQINSGKKKVIPVDTLLGPALQEGF
jgi:hypothetical protein